MRPQKPDWWDGMAARLEEVQPEDLPSEPWALRSSESRVVGRSMFRGGPYVTVTNNESFLRALKTDVRSGWDGPRMRTGALARDLADLRRVLDEKRA